MPEGHEHLDDDEKHLASLGYTQELNRSWSGFSNFAISFSIISILAGCFTSFGLGWNNGGPAAIAWGWPIVSGFILIIGLCMSELVSAYPTSGGIYWWAAKLGGPKAGFYTGWLNLIGSDRHPGVGGLRLRDVPGPHARHVQRDLARGLQPDQDVHLVRGHPGDLGDHQHLLVASAGRHQQHLGVVARRGRRGRHRDPVAAARAARQFLRRVRQDHQQQRHVRRRDVGYRRACCSCCRSRRS